jgi:hypothetical protein
VNSIIGQLKIVLLGMLTFLKFEITHGHGIAIVDLLYVIPFKKTAATIVLAYVHPVTTVIYVNIRMNELV